MNARDGFAALIGSWHTRGVVVDGGEHAGATVEGTDSYAWLGDRFVVHHADVTFAGRPQRGVEIFVLDGAVFEATAYTDTGEIERVRGGFDDDGLYRAGNETTRVTLHPGENALSARWEQLTDHGWVPWLDMTFTRRQD